MQDSQSIPQGNNRIEETGQSLVSTNTSHQFDLEVRVLAELLLDIHEFKQKRLQKPESSDINS